MALSTVSSLSESFISSVPLTGEEAVSATEKEKEGPTGDTPQDTGSTNGAPGPSTSQPSAVDMNTKTQNEDVDTTVDSQMHEGPQDVEQGQASSRQQASEGREAPAAPVQEPDNPLEIGGQNEDTIIGPGDTPGAANEQPSALERAVSEGDMQGGKKAIENGNESEASSDDEAILHVHS